MSSGISPLSSRRSCLCCLSGEHAMCRHRPNDEDGAMWIEENGERRRIKAKWLGHGYEKNPDGSYVEYPADPCACEQSGHTAGKGTCAAWVKGDRMMSGSRCGKPAKGEMEVPSRFMGAGVMVTKEMCGVHLAARRRVLANDEIREAKSQQIRETFERQKAANRASADWAERLEREFGIPVEAMKGQEVWVKVHPENLYAILAEVRGLLDEVYDTHPFSEGRENKTITPLR